MKLIKDIKNKKVIDSLKKQLDIEWLKKNYNLRKELINESQKMISLISQLLQVLFGIILEMLIMRVVFGERKVDDWIYSWKFT